MESWNWSSAPVKIIADDDRAVYHVHPEALSSKSPVWEARLKGSWKDDDRALDWTDFAHITVHCAVNFLYTGRYDVNTIADRFAVRGSCVHKEAPALDIPGTTCSNLNEGSEVVESQPDSQNNAGASNAHALQTAKDSDLGGTSAPVQDACPSCKQGQLLMTHCKVYVFATQFQCKDMQNHALHKLKGILQDSVNLNSDFLYSVVEASRYVYDHTLSSSSDPDSAREALIRYVVKHLDLRIALDDVFITDSDFMKDLFRHTLQRAITAEVLSVSQAADFSEQTSEMESHYCRKGKPKKKSILEDSWEI